VAAPPEPAFRLADQEYDPAIPVDSIAEHPDNPNEGDVGVIEESMQAHGFYGAILVQRSTRLILAGNHRHREAAALGAETLPGFWLDVDDDTAARILSMDNESTRRGRTNAAKLVALLKPLPEPTRGTGITQRSLVDLLRGDLEPGLTDPDRTPEIPADPVTKPGDVWLLGPHRLVCGDALAPGVLAVMTRGLDVPGLVYADPPYGIDIVHRSGGGPDSVGPPGGRWGGKVGHHTGTPFGGIGGGYKPRNKRGSVETGGGPVIHTTPYLPVTGDDSTDTARDGFTLARSTWPKAAQVWWGANHYAAAAQLPDSSGWLVWDKQTGANHFADAELAWTTHRGTVRMFRHRWSGLIRESEQGHRIHPSQKPVALAVWAFGVVDAQAARGVVVDPFAGSGSTLIAAQRTRRTAALAEVEPGYCDLICRRFQEFTGTVPVLEANGEPHDFTVAG
jgi:hypothetical protein